MTSDEPHTIYLVSDGTCRTCEQVVEAALVQFDPGNLRLVRKANVRRANTISDLIKEAAENRAMVFYTLVAEEAREAITQTAHRFMVPVVDLLGPVMVGLYDVFKHAPRAEPGILHRPHQAHVDRIDAVDYTLEHDDGRAIHELGHADVVLVGVSRVSKSTTCFYLGYSGIRAANVPLFSHEPPPKELIALDARRVIGLTANPYRLQSVRESRIRQWGMDINDAYGDRANIAKELRAANEHMGEHGWRCIDISYKAIEEIAREVLRMLEDAGLEVDRRAWVLE